MTLGSNIENESDHSSDPSVHNVAEGIDASISGFEDYQSPETYFESLLNPINSATSSELFRVDLPTRSAIIDNTPKDTLPKKINKRWRRRRTPRKRPPFHRWLLHQFGEPNFIKIHYLYILLWIIVTSILLFAPGGIKYIDAFFLACAVCTQGGMTT